MTTTVIDDPRTGAVTTVSFASSSARTPNYVNVVEIGATLIPSGVIEPVVIANKAYITSSTDDRVGTAAPRDFVTSTIGNYRNTYEAVNSVGQKGAFNGKYLDAEGGPSEASSEYVSGTVDYSIPDRNKYKTVIRSLFNAPGSPETMMRGLDTAAREYSVYNNLNYRNRGVRNPLNTLYEIPSAFGGYQSGSTVTASFHGIQRNGYTRKAYSGDSIIDQKVWDNAFVQTQIPATDLGYAWIAESYQSADMRRYQTSSILAPNEQITFVSSSDLGSYYTTIFGGLRIYPIPEGESALATSASQFLADNFVGLNYSIYEPITSSTNILGYPASTAYYSGLGADAYQNEFYVASQLAAYEAALFNGLMNKRNGPYGYPAWKAYRKDAHPIVRAHKEVNTISYLEENKGLNIFGHTVFLPNIVNVTQSPVSTTEPMYIQLLGTSFDFKTSYENKKLGFTNPTLQAFKGGFETTLGNKKTFLDKVLKEEDLSVSKLTVRSGIYPKTEFQFLDATRTRDVFDNKWWRNSIADRVQGSTTNTFGLVVDHLAAAGSPYQSRWSMDSREDFANGEPLQPYGLLSNDYGALTDSGSGELQNAYTTFHFFRNLAGSPATAPYTAYMGPLYSRRTIEYITEADQPLGTSVGPTTSVTGGYLNTGEALWEVGSQSGKNPFYNSYDAYAEELRIQGKEYSIVPEFVISDHMDSYLATGLDFKTELANFLSLTGSSNTSIATRYSAAELSEVLGTVQNDTELGIKKFGLKASALLKLLPYEGFYPQQRTLQLVAELSKSYTDAIEGIQRDGFPSVDHTYKEQNFYEPYCMPGILYNTIKSGLAVDYPQYQYNGSFPTSGGPLVANISTSSTSYIGDYIHKDILNPTGSLYSSYETELNVANLRGANSYSSSLPFLNKFLGVSALWTLNNPSVERIPFEAILDPRTHYQGRYYTFKPNHLERVSGTFALNTGEPKLNYSLMSNNFFAETVNFFLKGGLSSYESHAANLFDFDTTKEYAMDFVITNGNISSVSQYSQKLLKDFPALSGSSPVREVFFTGSQVPTASANCVMYDRAGAFGYPSTEVYYTGSDWQITNLTHTNFTPPYYDGFARARYRFQPTEEQHTLGEIVSKMTIEHLRATENPLSILLSDPTYSSTKTYTRQWNEDDMRLDSSFILDSVVETKKVIYDEDGDPAGFEEFDSPRSKLVIHSKYECPVLNFKNADITRPAIGSTTAPKGMWHQYGEIPDYSSVGIFTQVVDIPIAERTVSASTASLADALGIQKEKKAIGRLATSRRIEEALVVLPYYVDNRSPDQKTRFFEFDSNALQGFMKAANKKSVKDEDDQIVRQIRLMKKYVFPPFMDFVSFPNEASVKSPLMYIFEFGRTLSQQDLADIWQGVLPEPGLTAVKREAVIDLDTTYANLPRSTFVSGKEEKIETIEIIEGNVKTLLASTQAPIMKGDVKLLDKINFNDLDFFVFKVKKRGEFEYSKITKNTEDDQFQFDFKATGLKAQMPFIDDFGQKRLAYSYNYPYDFFSLIELAKVDAQIEMEGEEE